MQYSVAITLISINLFFGGKMNDLVTMSLIGIAVLAVLGLGVRVVMNLKAGNNVKNKIKNVSIGGDFVGRDKK